MEPTVLPLNVEMTSFHTFFSIHGQEFSFNVHNVPPSSETGKTSLKNAKLEGDRELRKLLLGLEPLIQQMMVLFFSDQGGREHIVEIILPSKYPEVEPTVSSELPSALELQWWKEATLKDVVDQFIELTSDQPNRDELDFEFLGNVSGEPYILQTNIYADGYDDREERTYLWFDPTADFHTYSVFWNLYHIIFYVDSVPIRVYKNHADKGIPFPRRQPMGIYASLWNGDSWATRGGLVKVDWEKAPFIASFRNFKADACVWNGNPRFCRAASSTNWWNKRRYSTLDATQRRLLKWARKNYLIYDYCTDTRRFKTLPKECTLPKY